MLKKIENKHFKKYNHIIQLGKNNIIGNNNVIQEIIGE